ncbi:protein arginine kinase [Planctomycetales bacterium ZRK34]|nr:protein arginine kinase [Planctomycetales bacterium ZRK34]
MSLPDLAENASPWLRKAGPEGDVVISSRVRLARNLAGYPFLTQASPTQRRDILHMCRRRILDSNLAQRMLWVDLSESPRLDRDILVERHLISRQHSRGKKPRGVALADDETIAIMVNEEDHVRLQVLRSGMQLDEAYAQADHIDDTLEAHLDFAYSPKLGYLTACPTNVGTGIRVSVMLHLPALKLTGEVDKMRRAAKDMHLAVRGFYGEGTEAAGDLYQISNQTTLGRSERQILRDFAEVVIPRVVEYERRARIALLEKRPVVVDDKVHRALGALRTARLLSSEEALYLLSAVRMGVSMGRLDGVSMAGINELLLLTQPGHLQRMAGVAMSGAERREFRARYIRRRLGG